MPIFDKSEVKHNAVIYERNCIQCGIKFYTKRPKGIYCSDLCRCHAYLDRRKTKKENDTFSFNFKSKKDIQEKLFELTGKKVNIDIEFYTFPEKRQKELLINGRKYTIYRTGRSKYCLTNF